MVLNKLKSNDFKYLREKGKTFKTSNFLFVYNLSQENPDSEGQLNFGCTITRKVGKAVLRNKLRRLLRESLRSHLSKEAPFLSQLNQVKLDLNIVVLRQNPEALLFSNVHEQISYFFKNRVPR